MRGTRALEPAVELLFALVQQDPLKDPKLTEQALVQVEALIKTIRRIGDFKKLEYERLSKTLNKEIKFDNDISLDARDENGNTFLAWAAYNGHENYVKLLLEHKANPDLIDDAKTGGTALAHAARKGHTNCLKLLLEYKANPDKANEQTGTTPLILAAAHGHADVVNLLLGANANVDLPSKKGKTALDYAAKRQDIKMIILLLKVQNSSEALYRVAEIGNTEAVKSLLANPNIRVNIRASLTETISTSKGTHETIVSPENGATPLYVAAKNGHTAVVKLLLAVDNIDVNVTVKSGATSLCAALEMGHIEVVQLLLATRYIQVNKPMNNGVTPFLKAVQNGHVEVESLLKNGTTPFMATVKKRFIAQSKSPQTTETPAQNQIISNSR